MKFSPLLITGLTLIILGLVFVIGGALLKITHNGSGWVTGNNLIILGMFIELIGLFVSTSLLTKHFKNKN